MRLPEGLYLATDEAGNAVIRDPQDLTWAILFQGGGGDPVDWPITIITKTCEALRITEAFDDEGNGMTVDGFCHWYLGEEAMAEGFLP